jgi:hypothetical protein
MKVFMKTSEKFVFGLIREFSWEPMGNFVFGLIRECSWEHMCNFVFWLIWEFAWEPMGNCVFRLIQMYKSFHENTRGLLYSDIYDLSLLKLWVRIPLIAKSIRYNIMWYVNDLWRQVDGFLRVLWFPPPIKLTTMI